MDAAIEIKPGVRFHKDTWGDPLFSRMADVAQQQAPKGYSITITSGCDSKKHRSGSFHYKGWAVDIRRRDFPHDVLRWAKRISASLGDQYFVLVEKTHVHIHYWGRSNV